MEQMLCAKGQLYQVPNSILTVLILSYSLHTALAVQCPDLPNPDNGQVTFSNGFMIGSVATYECSQGFTLEGDVTQTCQADGTWSGVPATCARKFIAVVNSSYL